QRHRELLKERREFVELPAPGGSHVADEQLLIALPPASSGNLDLAIDALAVAADRQRATLEWHTQRRDPAGSTIRGVDLQVESRCDLPLDPDRRRQGPRQRERLDRRVVRILRQRFAGIWIDVP